MGDEVCSGAGQVREIGIEIWVGGTRLLSRIEHAKHCVEAHRVEAHGAGDWIVSVTMLL